MSRRFSSATRRGQIVQSTLALLADTPVDRITTRQVARELGISQPALFRHFRSRDEILEAVVVHTREALEQLAAEVLASEDAPLASLTALMRGLFAYVERNPGMPRLLFYDAGEADDAPYHRPLTQLVAMQRSLAAELVGEAQRSGEVSGEVDPLRAASLLLATLQGLLLQWQLTGRRTPLGAEAEAMLGFWRAALVAGEPRRTQGAGRAEAGRAASADPIAALDACPLLAAGDEPLDAILALLRELPADGIAKLLTPFRPTPLLSLLSARGQRAEARELEPGCWGVEVLGPDAPAIEDLRELEAPQPLERILAATAALAPGAAFAARTPRHPRMLLPRLEERGLRFQVYDEPDGTALIHVRRPV